MAEYVYEDEDGKQYVYEDVDSSSEVPETSINGVPDYNNFLPADMKPEPTPMSWGEDFVSEMQKPGFIKNAVTDAAKGVAGAVKGVGEFAGAAMGDPASISKSTDTIKGYYDRNLKGKDLNNATRTVIGDVGSVAARTNPAFAFTGPAYDKILQWADPENFPPTTGAQDANKFVGEAAGGSLGVLAPKVVGAMTKPAQGALSGVGKAANFLKSKLADKIIPEQVPMLIKGDTIPEVRRGFEKGATIAAKPETIIPGTTYAETKTPELIKTTVEPRVDKTFNETMTRADIERSMKYSARYDPETGTVKHRLETAIGELKDAPGGDILSLPAKQSYEALLGTKKRLGSEIGAEVAKAEEARPKNPGQPGGLPPKGNISFERADAYVNNLPEGSMERLAAEEYLATQKAAFESWDGNLIDLQKRKVKQDDFWTSAYRRDQLQANEAVKAEVAKAMAKDMRNKIDADVPSVVPLNRHLQNLHTVDPIVMRRAAGAQLNATQPPKTTTKITPGTTKPAFSTMPKRVPGSPAMSELGKFNEGSPARSEIRWAPEQVIPEQRVPGEWAGAVNKAAKILAPVGSGIAGAVGGGPMGAAGGVVSGLGANVVAETMGGVANAAGKLAGGLGMATNKAASMAPKVGSLANRIGQAAQPVAPVLGMASEPRLISRSTENLTPEDLSNLLLKTSQTPQGTIAQGLIKKLGEAVKQQDMTTAEKLHSDLARLFPDEFESGQGVNGKLFYKDEQQKMMDLLHQLHRMGKVDSIHLAEQQNSFNNPQDGRILPTDHLMPGLYEQPRNMPNQMVNGTRRYGY